jgi:hypothetical protein
MNWEDLKVYRPLPKEDLKAAYKDFTKIVSENLLLYGFETRGRKLIKLSNDLFHIVHLDTRGSWMGVSDSFKTEISIGTIYDTDTFVLNYELTGSKRIEEIIPKIRNYYRITEEYKLLADFITRKIRESIIPYFSQFQMSKDVLSNRGMFKIDNMSEITERNSNLILYCELANKVDVASSEILAEKLNKLQRLNAKDSTINEIVELRNLVQEKDWDKISEKLLSNKQQVLKKLKFKEN